MALSHSTAISAFLVLAVCLPTLVSADGSLAHVQTELAEIRQLSKELLGRIEQLESSLAKADVNKVPTSSTEIFGLELEPVRPEEVKRVNGRYRGGMRVIAVRDGSTAAKEGIRRGDYLVGLHVWEITSPETVKYVLARRDLDELSPIKFYVLRGTETLYGHLPVNER